MLLCAQALLRDAIHARKVQNGSAVVLDVGANHGGCLPLPNGLDPSCKVERRMEQLSAAAYACAELVFSVCLVCRRHAGLYALYAAALGADVVAVEPQSSLCRLILASANYNARAAVRAKLPLQPLLPSNLRACSCYAIMHAYLRLLMAPAWRAKAGLEWGRVWVYNHAVLETREMVSVSLARCTARPLRGRLACPSLPAYLSSRPHPGTIVADGGRGGG